MESTGRQKIEAALSRDGARDIPAVLCYEGIYVRDHWQQLTQFPWWYQQSPQIEEQVCWRRDVIARTGQDWFDLPQFYSHSQRDSFSIDEQSDEVYLVDRLRGTVNKLVRPQIGGWQESGRVASVCPDFLADTTNQIDALVPLFPDFDAAGEEKTGRDDLARALLREFGANLFPLGYVASPLWRTYQLWGFEGMMQIIATQPGMARYACDRIMTQCRYAIQEAAWLGAAGVWIEDCLTDMISPDAFTTLNLPYLRLITSAIREAGMLSIYYFCGNPAGKFDLLLSVDADALALEESKKGFVIDIEDVVERVQGRYAVLGNLNAISMLQDGSEVQLRAEITRQIVAGRHNGSRFIMSLGSPVTPGTTVERVRLYCDLTHDIGSM